MSVTVCKHCVGKCQRGMSITWYNHHFNKLLVGSSGIPFVIGVVASFVHHEPFYAAIGSFSAVAGTYAVELIGSSAYLKEIKRSLNCVNKS
jgi:hypothetical protein